MSSTPVRRFGRSSPWRVLFLFCFIASRCSAFLPPIAPVRVATLSKQPTLSRRALEDKKTTRKDELSQLTTSPTGGYKTQLYMSSDEGGGIKGFLFSLFGVALIVLYVATSFLPMMGDGRRDVSISDSVVTRQDAPGKLQNYEAMGDKLSRSSIQEKLNTVPVFYLVDKDNVMSTDIYMSYADASDAAGSLTVKATTLDQVTYPLVLKRGRMRMAPPPDAVQKAEAEIADSTTKTYRLIPSKTAVKDAASFNMELAKSDIPLFVADRLAFAGNKGPQLPLFLEKADCETSYNRLRESSTKLPETPNIRTSTLMDTLNSMEKGTRPGLSQLAFYSTAEDLLKATDMMMQP